MPWSGGSFSRTNGVNTGSTTWQQDEAGAVDIEADRHDTHDQDLADGIDACLAKDGSNAMTGDLAMGGNDISNCGAASIDALGLDLGPELTISSGAVTATNSYHLIDTEGDAATDDLDTISFSGQTGTILIIQATDSSRTIVAKDGTGNLYLEGDFSMDHAGDTLTLIFYSGIGWRELSRSNNTDGGNSAPLKYTTGSATRSATVTPTDDASLAGWTLAAATTYKVTGCLKFQCASSGIDARIRLQTDNAFTVAALSHVDVSEGATVGGDVMPDPTDDTGGGFVDIAGGSDTVVHLSGFITTNAAAVVDFQWAQWASNVTAVQLDRSSWIHIEKM